MTLPRPPSGDGMVLPAFDPADPLGSLVAAQRTIWKALPTEALDDLLTALVEEIDGRDE